MKIKHVVLTLCAVVLLLSSCKPQKPAMDLTGNWHWEGDGKYFDLKLFQSDYDLAGFHSGGTDDGSRIDSADENQFPSLQGLVRGRVVTGAIQSQYNDVSLAYKITWKNDNEIVWELTKTPSAEVYIPLKVTMVRDTREQSTRGSVTYEGDFETYKEMVKQLADNIEDRTLSIEPEEINLDDSAEGGVIRRYYDGDKIIKAVEEHNGESGSVSRTYYFDDNGYLVQVNQTVTMFESDEVTTEVFYFYEGEMLRWINGADEEVHTQDSQEFADKAEDLNAFVRDYCAMM